jgi:hypothetical protein
MIQKKKKSFAASLHILCIHFCKSLFFVLMNLKCMYFHFLFLCAVVKNFDLVIPDSMSRISEFKDIFYIECIQFLRSTQFSFSISPLSWSVYCMLSL